jgi:hypothetical protein
MPNGQAYTDAPQTYKEAILQVNMKLDNIETDVGEIRSSLIAFMDESRKCREEDNRRFGSLEIGQGKRETKIDGIVIRLDAQDDRLDGLDGKTTLWGSGGIVMAIIAGIIGWFK